MKDWEEGDVSDEEELHESIKLYDKGHRNHCE